jgi:hypothetical protein
MPRACTACRHPRARELDRELLRGIPRARLAREFSLKEPAVRNHYHRHLGLGTRLDRGVLEIDQREQAQRVVLRLEALLDQAVAAEDSLAALSICRELRGWHSCISRSRISRRRGSSLAPAFRSNGDKGPDGDEVFELEVPDEPPRPNISMRLE